MYSYEDRIRAVKLYIKLGKRSAATIRQLGYPTRKALKTWNQEYEQDRDLPKGYVRSKWKYSEEQKKLAVEHYLGHDRCLAATVQALGYPVCDTLACWIDQLRPETRIRVASNAGGVRHSQQAKQAAVIDLCTRQTSAQAIAQKLAVSRPTLYNWKNQLLGREVPASMKPPNKPPPASDRAELEQQVESLRRDIRHLQLEHDLLKKANELLKKGLGVDLPLLTNREKTLLVDALKHTYALPELFAELDLAREAPTSTTGHGYRSKTSTVRCVAPSSKSSSSIIGAMAIAGSMHRWAGSTS
jgi:putative transposase